LLNGTYYFREVIYVSSGDAAGDIGQALSEFGTITFNGTGGYTIPNGIVNSSNRNGQQALNTTGTYTFSASGYGYLTNPLSSSSATYTNYGLVSNGVLIASATENGFNSMFIAVPVGTSPATNSAFQGNYQVSAFFPGGAATSAGASYQLNPDGNGNLGTVNISGYSSAGGTYTQTSAVKYSFSNGAGIIAFPNSNNANFYPEAVYMYISPDRNFIFGGDPFGFDMFVGVKKSSGATFSGLYYEAGLDFDGTNLSTAGYADMDSYYGSFNASGANLIGHERFYDGTFNYISGNTYAQAVPSAASSGAYTVTNGSYQTQYTFAGNGAIRIAYGVGPALGLSVALQAPVLTGNGVYLNPEGVVNAASYAPFTAGVSPGEIVVLYGSNLAPSLMTASALPLPGTLNGVTVTVNGITAPIYYVSSGQVSVVIPYSAYYQATSGFPIARIVLTNASGMSNAVTEFFNLSTPGIFSQTASGIGVGSVYHATATGFVAVTNSNPAKPGETVVAYVSGLGATFPSVMEGNATPASPLTNTVNNFDIFIGGAEACGSETNATPCPFVGLAPYLADVYQVNIPIPSGATSGLNSVEITGPDSDTFQVNIPIGTGTASTSDRLGSAPDAVTPRLPRHSRPMQAKPRVMPCFLTDQTCSARGI
jgi:uncharacterized protein (TIGR03437 family)